MAQNQNPQQHWGGTFRVPGASTNERIINDAGNTATVSALSQANPATVKTSKLENVDIVTGLIIHNAITFTTTQAGGMTVTKSELFPYNFIQNVLVRFQATYAAYNLPGDFGIQYQQLRPLFNRPGRYNIGNGIQASYPYTSGTPEVYTFDLEIPFAHTFDLWYEKDPTGKNLSRYQRALIVPEYLAGNNRVINPVITYAAGLTNNGLLSPFTKPNADTTSTFAGSATSTIYRSGFYFDNNLAADPSPLITNWKVAARYAEYPTSGQGTVNVVLDDIQDFNGQLLLIWFHVWDPTLNGGVGGKVPASSYSRVEYRVGSSTPTESGYVSDGLNQHHFSQVHQGALGANDFGFEFAITDDGLYTNEDAKNILSNAGNQLHIEFNSGSAPNAAAYVRMGAEVAQLVTAQ